MESGSEVNDKSAAALELIKSRLRDVRFLEDDNNVTGYLDGKDSLTKFLKDYDSVCSTSYSIRSSVRKSMSMDTQRYGNEERIYWESSNGQPKIPFTGTPFVVRSSVIKDCQYGPRYYKPKKKKGGQSKTRTSWNVQSKKKNCPAQIVVREIVVFVDYILPPVSEGQHHRQRKKELIKELRNEVNRGKVSGVTRYYIQVPLPHVHMFHPQENPSQAFVDILSELKEFDHTLANAGSLERATHLLQQAVQVLKSNGSTSNISNASLGNTKVCVYESKRRKVASVLQETQNDQWSDASSLLPKSVVNHTSMLHQYSSTKQTALAEMQPGLRKTSAHTAFPLPSLPTKTEGHFFHTPLQTVEMSQDCSEVIGNTW